MIKHKRTLILLLTILAVCVFGFTACKDNKKEPEYTGDYEIRLTAIGSTTIKAGKTVQLRASVTGTTQKDVSFKSSDSAVATVSGKGLVTGLKEGAVTIECSLVIEPACKKTITITVERAVAPTAVEIGGADSAIQWTNETLQLSAQVTPQDASELVIWESSDNAVATVSAGGLVTFHSQGEVTITVTSAENSSITASVTFTVKEGFFRSDLGSPYWDISTQSDDVNPHISIDLDESKLGYHSCYLANVSSTRYYAEATFDIPRQISPWVWQGVGFGSGLSETSARYFIFSPRVEGQGNNYNKFIVKDLPNETWPAITERSQCWGENGLNSIDWQNSPVKVALLRDNNKYYYLINDRLMYVDENTVYDDVPTMPILVSVDLPAVVSNYSVITEDAQLDAKLQTEEFSKSFYVSNGEIVDYESDDSFIFKSNSVLSKDNKVKSIGDSAKLIGDFTVEFDIADMLCNNAHTNGFSGLALNISRYDSADTVETFLVGRSSEQPGVQGFTARYLSWNYTKSMDDPAAPYFWSESSRSVFENASATHHIKITRTINDNIAAFKMFVDGTEVEFDRLSSSFNTMTSRYTGAYIIWVAGEYTSGQITNFRFQSNLNK